MSIDNVEDIPPRVQYISAASQTAFDYPFPIFADEDLVVIVDGATKVLTTHYSVSGAGDDTGGTVTFLSGQTAGAIVTIYRDIAIQRTSDFQTNGPMSSATFNDELDRLTLVQQELELHQQRALQLSIDDEGTSSGAVLPSKEARASKFLAFDANGDVIASEAVSDGDALLRAELIAGASSLVKSTGIKYAITEAEIGLTIVNEYLPPGVLYRYGTNTTPGTTVLTTAVQAAIDQYRNGGAPIVMPPEVVVSAQLNAFSSAGLDMYIPPSGTLRFAANQANSQRLLTATGAYIHDSATDSKLCRIWGGGTLDGNKDNQGTYTGGEKEQSHCIFLAAASNSGGKLRVDLDDITCINSTGDGVAVYTNVDLTFTSLRQVDCWRSSMSITGGNTKVRGTGLQCIGTPVASSYMADFDIEVDGVGYNSSYRVDIEINNLECAGSFDVGTYSGNTTHGSRVLLNGVNHTGPMANFGCRGSIVKISDSVITFGPIDGSNNRIIWPSNLTFNDVNFIFSEGSISATSTFGLDVWFNTGGTTDTGQTLTLTDCKYIADSTVESGDTVVGIFPRAYAAAENNTIVIDGGEFDSTLDDMVRLSAGGKIIVKNTPTVNCARTFNLTFGSTNYWDIKVFGSFNFGSGMTNYAAVDQGSANNVVTHYGTQYDEAFNNLTPGGGSPGSNAWRGYRTIYVASAPTAATHGNVGDRAVIKAPASGSPVEYVCTTQGWGSGAVWKVLTTAA